MTRSQNIMAHPWLNNLHSGLDDKLRKSKLMSKEIRMHSSAAGAELANNAQCTVPPLGTPQRAAATCPRQKCPCTRFFGPTRVGPQTASASLQPFLHSTDHSACDMCRKGPHLCRVCGWCGPLKPNGIDYDQATGYVPYRLRRFVWRTWIGCWRAFSRPGCVWRIRGWTRTAAARQTSTKYIDSQKHAETSPPQSHLGKVRRYPVHVGECTVPLHVITVAYTMRTKTLRNVTECYRALWKRCGSLRNVTEPLRKISILPITNWILNFAHQ